MGMSVCVLRTITHCNHFADLASKALQNPSDIFYGTAEVERYQNRTDLPKPPNALFSDCCCWDAKPSVAVGKWLIINCSVDLPLVFPLAKISKDTGKTMS